MTSCGGHNVREWLRAHETLTVRCTRCDWTRTGLAVSISKRGYDSGVLAKQKRHADAHKAKDERKRLWNARWRAENRTAYLEEARRYRERNRDGIRARQNAARAQKKAA